MACIKHRDRVRPLQLGCGLIEVLVAVLVFSTGMMGLAAAQLVGKKAGYEATQRSIATTLVVDILERIRANPGELAAYVADNVGDEGAGMPLPTADCTLMSCLPGELATYDLWQWESLLLGSAEQEGARYVGGLVSGRACISYDGGSVSVAISWRGVGPAGDTQASPCGSETAGLYDDPSGPPGNNLLRRSSVMFSYVGAN
jgi:type IV pilus assembly protein PilV